MRESVASRRAAAEERGESWILNLRFSLILLVFLASGIEPVIERFPAMQAFYNWITAYLTFLTVRLPKVL